MRVKPKPAEIPMIDLRPFQKRFLKGAFGRGVRRAALSLPRGNGKSHLAAYILRRCLTPGDALHVAGAEYLLLSGSLEQARQVFNPLVADLPESSTGHKPAQPAWGYSTRPAKPPCGLFRRKPRLPSAWAPITRSWSVTNLARGRRCKAN